MKFRKGLKIFIIVIIALILIPILISLVNKSRIPEREPAIGEEFMEESMRMEAEYGAAEMPSLIQELAEFSESLGKDTQKSSSSQVNTQEEGVLTQRKIIRNGSLSLTVKSVVDVVEEIKKLTAEMEGYIKRASVNEISAGTKTGRVVVRIPADKFDETFESFKKMAEWVNKEEISASDVTEKHIDLQAQLKNAQAEESQYLKILERAVKIEDILKVTQRLAAARNKVERLQGQMKYLENQIDFSTINVSLDEETAEILGVRWKPLVTVKRAFNSSMKACVGLIKFIVWAITYLPFMAGMLALLWLVWKVLLLIKKLFSRKR